MIKLVLMSCPVLLKMCVCVCVSSWWLHWFQLLVQVSSLFCPAWSCPPCPCCTRPMSCPLPSCSSPPSPTIRRAEPPLSNPVSGFTSRKETQFVCMLYFSHISLSDIILRLIYRIFTFIYLFLLLWFSCLASCLFCIICIYWAPKGSFAFPRKLLWNPSWTKIMDHQTYK